MLKCINPRWAWRDRVLICRLRVGGKIGRRLSFPLAPYSAAPDCREGIQTSLLCEPGSVAESLYLLTHSAKTQSKVAAQSWSSDVCLVSQSARTQMICCGFLVPITWQASIQVQNATWTQKMRSLIWGGWASRDLGNKGWVLKKKIKVQACQCGLKKKNAWKEGRV